MKNSRPSLTWRSVISVTALSSLIVGGLGLGARVTPAATAVKVISEDDSLFVVIRCDKTKDRRLIAPDRGARRRGFPFPGRLLEPPLRPDRC